MLIIEKIFGSQNAKKKLTETLKKSFNVQYCELLGQCREGIYYSVKYAIEKTGKTEVIISPYTLFHVVNMILLAGGKPVFLDLKESSLEVDLKGIQEKTSPNTAAIILTSLFGPYKNISKIKKFSKERKIKLIEDCAVSLGTKDTYGRWRGLEADITLFSFQAMKNVQALLGGAYITNDIDFDKWMVNERLELEDLGFLPLFKKMIFIFFVDLLTRVKILNLIFFHFLKYGYFYKLDFILNNVRADNIPHSNLDHYAASFCKMTNTQAKFVLRGLLEEKENSIRRYEKVKFYQKNLKSLKNIKLIQDVDYKQSNNLEFPILCAEKDNLFDFLARKNFYVRKYYYRNLANLSCYRAYNSNCKNAQKIEEQIITLPCYPKFTEKNMEQIVDLLKIFDLKQ